MHFFVHFAFDAFRLFFMGSKLWNRDTLETGYLTWTPRGVDIDLSDPANQPFSKCCCGRPRPLTVRPTYMHRLPAQNMYMQLLSRMLSPYQILKFLFRSSVPHPLPRLGCHCFF